MVDVDWLIKAMSGDNLVLRLHITPGRSTKVKIHVFTYWNDDMVYIGSKVVYKHHEGERHPIKRLECTTLPGYIGEWREFFEAEAEYWPPHWDLTEPIVCTIGTRKNNTRRIPMEHPQVMVHIARFQAAVFFTNIGGLEKDYGITLDNIEKRLEGIVRGGVQSWRNLTDQF